MHGCRHTCITSCTLGPILNTHVLGCTLQLHCIHMLDACMSWGIYAQDNPSIVSQWPYPAMPHIMLKTLPVNSQNGPPNHIPHHAQKHQTGSSQYCLKTGRIVPQLSVQTNIPKYLRNISQTSHGTLSLTLSALDFEMCCLSVFGRCLRLVKAFSSMISGLLGAS